MMLAHDTQKFFALCTLAGHYIWSYDKLIFGLKKQDFCLVNCGY